MKIQIRIVKWDSRCIRFGIVEKEAWENCEYLYISNEARK